LFSLFFDFLKGDEKLEENLESVTVGFTNKKDINEVQVKKQSNRIGLFAITGTITTIMFVSLLVLLNLSLKYRKNKLNKKKEQSNE